MFVSKIMFYLELLAYLLFVLTRAALRKREHPCTYLTFSSSKRDSNTTLPMAHLAQVAKSDCSSAASGRI